VIHTFVALASELAYCYKRGTVTIWGNVVDATHGETRRETLGDGNGAAAFQRFTLKASPLTYIAAATAEGAASSLEVRVNEVRWHEREMLAGVAQTDHVFVARIADDNKTSITFGDGRSGARLPTGRENVRAVYRTGIGRAANVDGGRISLLASRPLGLKEVTNPLRASGGADPDSDEQLRRNIPIALQALDRLVSVQDHADFARAFAGIGKASAARLSDGRRQITHVTIAGVGDVPILESSDLFTNLNLAFSRLGNLRQPVELATRELVLLVIAARVRVAEDYRWDLVEPHVRAALLDTFGFERRELGQPATSSEVIATIQRVPGVEYVDLDTFGGIPEFVAVAGPPPSRRPITPGEIAALVKERLEPPPGTTPTDCNWLPPFCPVVAELAGPDENGLIRPAQLAILSPDAPNTLVLSSIP
ncbi:MAG: putative baseplate assembly protein, partial [Gemmatimonadales bacterium]